MFRSPHAVLIADTVTLSSVSRTVGQEPYVTLRRQETQLSDCANAAAGFVVLWSVLASPCREWHLSFFVLFFSPLVSETLVFSSSRTDKVCMCHGLLIPLPARLCVPVHCCRRPCDKVSNVVTFLCCFLVRHL